MNTPLYLNRSLATAVGSLPHNNPQEACDLVFRYFKEDIPFWPQLPKRNFKENMYVQFAQGLPGVVIDESAKEIYINTDNDSYARELEAAYEHYLADDLDYFAIGKDYASGFYEFINRIKAMNCAFIKGQTIGPVSFGLTVTDQNKKASIYEQEFCDCLVKVLVMKVKWQLRKLREAIDAAHSSQLTAHRPEGGGLPSDRQSHSSQDKPRIIIFIDEPYLVSIGSSFFNIKIEDVARMIKELVEAVHSEGALAGIHCCGNTDWGLVLKTGVDILNFDAYNYLETIFLYRKELDNFLEKNGILAWGIVPTTAKEALPAIDSLLKRMAPAQDLTKGAVKEKFCLISPACGLGSLPLERAEAILDLTLRLARSL